MKKENEAALQTFKKGVAQIKPDSDPNIVSDFYAVMGDILHEKGLEKQASKLMTAVYIGVQITFLR